MGQMKSFEIWLANCIFQYRMTDEEIIRATKKRWSFDDSEETLLWLYEEIDSVRAKTYTYHRL